MQSNCRTHAKERSVEWRRCSRPAGACHPSVRVWLFYCLRCHIGSVHCFCGLKILILNGSGLQIQTWRHAAEHPQGRGRGPTGTFFSWIVNRSILIVGTYGADCEPAASENVRLGRPNASREDVLEALHQAQCDDILAKLPQGIDTLKQRKPRPAMVSAFGLCGYCADCLIPRDDR